MQLTNKFKVSIISNFLLEPYFEKEIKKYFSEIGEEIQIQYIAFEECFSEFSKKLLLDSQIVVVWLNFETLFPDVWNNVRLNLLNEDAVVDNAIMQLSGVIEFLENFIEAQIICFSFEDYYNKMYLNSNFPNRIVKKLNLAILDTINERISVIDLKMLIAEVGIKNAYDFKNKYRWNSPYSKELISVASREICKRYAVDKGLTPKCLVLDCDNVLWGGVITECGIEKLRISSFGLGRTYQDFQRFVFSLYLQGVILAVCSKNDFDDVIRVFNEHDGMVLKEEHISIFCVNWDSKSNNISQIAKELNIGSNSIVFVDDSPSEIIEVKTFIPEVKTILFELETIYEQLKCFNLKDNVELCDIIKRNQTYRMNLQRKTRQSQYNNYEDYLASLDMKIDIHIANEFEFARISELTQRANKFTNGNRYTIKEIKERIKNPKVTLYSVYLRDCFNDLGLVGVMEIEDETLTSFVLSCRAFGRKVEAKMIAFIKEKHTICFADFKDTNKNLEFKKLLQELLVGVIFQTI